MTTIAEDLAASAEFRSRYQTRDGSAGLLPVSAGGTGAKTAAAALTALGAQGVPAATGLATLVGGAATVTDANITANSVIELDYSTRGGTPGAVYVSAITASTSFVITSTSNTDTSKIFYRIRVY